MKTKFLFIILLSSFFGYTQTWTQKTNVSGSVRNAAMGFSIGGYGYMGTGYSGSGMLQDFWRYDPVSDTWTQMANFTGAGRFGAAAFSIGNKGYCGLGSTGYPSYNFVVDFYEYDVSSNTWTQKGNFPGPGRYTVATFVINNLGYMGTGWAPYYNDFWEYNPVTDTWLQKANFPGAARQSTVGFALNNFGYVGTGSNGTDFNDFYKYNPATNTWSAIANFPGTPRYGSISFVIGNIAYVGSGGSSSGNYFSDFYNYDPATNTWTPAPSYPGPGTRHSASFAIANCGYFGTGISTNLSITNSFWALCPCNVQAIINSPAQGCTGSTITFTNASLGGNSYQWDFGDGTTVSSNDTTVTHTYQQTGHYNILLIASSSCGNDTAQESIDISFLTASSVENPASCLANDGSITINVAGGSGNYSYNWSPNVSQTSSATNLSSGVYNVTVTDNTSGCTIAVQSIVQNTSGLTLSATAITNSTCSNSSNGSASVSASGATVPYTYLWTPGNYTTPTVNNLSPGDYTVRVNDYFGCPTYIIVHVGFQFPAPVLDLGPDTTMCNGSMLVLDAGSGFMTYLWSDNSSSQTFTVSSPGNYSVLITDSNGCNEFDDIQVSYVTCQAPPSHSFKLLEPPVMHIFPNPGTGNFSIGSDNLLNELFQVKIFDSFGKLILDKSYFSSGKNKNLDISNCPAGIYFIEINFEGEKYFKKLVKQ